MCTSAIIQSYGSGKIGVAKYQENQESTEALDYARYFKKNNDKNKSFETFIKDKNLDSLLAYKHYRNKLNAELGKRKNDYY